MYGLIDIGANTIRLALYTIANGNMKLVLSQKNTASLASLVGPDGALSEEGIARLLEVLGEFSAALDCVTVEEVFVFATASLRGLTNGTAVTELVKQRTGLAIQIISGEEEALYDYYGALLSHRVTEGLIVDVGGGSTEFITVKDGAPTAVRSVPVGSLRLYNKHVSGLLPTEEEYERMCKQLTRQFGRVDKSPVLYGIGGSARGLIRLCHRLWGPGEHLDRLPVKSLGKLFALNFAEPVRMQRMIADILGDRIRTLLPGAAVIAQAAALCGAKKLVVCPYGVREGYLYRALKERGVLG